jgi:hypothetical protein
MPAGASAGAEHQRNLALAEAHEREADRARRRAGRFKVAADTEKRTARRLAPLRAMGWTQLHDRRWPGTRNANVDSLLAGPGGVFILDTKCWSQVSISHGRIWRDQADVTDELSGLLTLTELAEAELADIGLAPTEVVPVVVLAGHRCVREEVGRIVVVGEHDVLAYVLGRGPRLAPSAVDAVSVRLRALFTPIGDDNRPSPVAVVPEPVMAPPTDDDLALLSADDVRSAVLVAALAAPVEEWMTFLHPDQARLVRRTFNGPARVGGPAGTGKTVVGLHRAAYLTATRPGRVLYTTFVRTLPTVLGSLYARMAPTTVDRVDFVNVHRFAVDLLRERGVTTGLDGDAADQALAEAWSRVGARGPLGGARQSFPYWRDEIVHVIKGRGLTRFEQYRDLDRVGRRWRIGVEQRKALWQLFADYEARLRTAGVHDYADVLHLAEQELRRAPLDVPYTAVIVDEIQDLSCVAVRMLHHVVGDAQDGLLLIGDGQQSVYPGGFTLAEAGVSVTGRGNVLRLNYRNTRQILAAANAVVAHDAFNDLDGLEEVGERDVECARQGPPPVRVDAADARSHDVALLSWVETTTSLAGVGPGDIAILAARHKTLAHCHAVLRRAGVPCIDLESYDGTPGDAVRLGTFKRAKGLEFKHVALPGLVDGPPSPRTDEADDVYRERVELERRELFVGMTRARDGLWLGYVLPG